MKYQQKNSKSKQGGFSLIEALVAFLILSVGMLGIASLQLISLKAGHTAVLRTLAVIKAEEMFERIRNNPVVLDPDNVVAAGSSYVVSAGDAGTSHGCNDSSGTINLCNFVQIAEDDIYNWKADLKNSLPNNTGTTASIDVLSKVPGTRPTAIVTISINWQERKQGTKAMTTMSYVVSAHICDNTAC